MPKITKKYCHRLIYQSFISELSAYCKSVAAARKKIYLICQKAVTVTETVAKIFGSNANNSRHKTELRRKVSTVSETCQYTAF